MFYPTKHVELQNNIQILKDTFIQVHCKYPHKVIESDTSEHTKYAANSLIIILIMR